MRRHRFLASGSWVLWDNMWLHHLQVTAEDESGIHLWDLRMLKFPVLELPGHTHWYVAANNKTSCMLLGIVTVWYSFLAFSSSKYIHHIIWLRKESSFFMHLLEKNCLLLTLVSSFTYQNLHLSHLSTSDLSSFNILGKNFSICELLTKSFIFFAGRGLLSVTLNMKD